MRKKNLCHRACYVFVKNCEGKYIVQIRSMSKEYCPGGYSLATGGVQGAGETNELSASRELEEEIGIKRKPKDLKLLDQFFYQDNRTTVWGNVFLVELKDEGKNLKLQEEEVTGVKYMTE